MQYIMNECSCVAIKPYLLKQRAILRNDVLSCALPYSNSSIVVKVYP
jgi:hypothetical protein